MCCSFIFVSKKSAQLQNLKAQTSSGVTGVSLCPRVLVFLHKESVRETECGGCDWENLETGNFSLFPFRRNSYVVQFVFSLVQTARREGSRGV